MPTEQPVSLYITTFNDADNLRAVLPTVSWADAKWSWRFLPDVR
jgi:hypothetical protein